MRFFPMRKFRIFVVPFVTVLLCFPLPGLAKPAPDESSANTSGDGMADLVIGDDPGSELQLEVRQVPLAEVLKTLEAKTHVPIHYSVLPEGLVTATCVGTTLKPVLECLLARKADLIVRYPRGAGSEAQIAEAWILGSKFDGNAAGAAYCDAASGVRAEKGSIELKQSKPSEEAAPDRTDELLKMAQSENAAERAEAIGALLSGGREGDLEVKAALEHALNDPEANVRAQAISSYARREGGAAADAIRQAMVDSSADVRMMAVDAISDDAVLLQQAVNDSDEVIRSLAALKLEELTQRTEDAP